MELKVTPYEQPAVIEFNFEELKKELTDRVHIYETVVYDETQIQQAKADRADLNKLKKALNDERIRREKEYLQPFNEFKTKINEIITIIDKPVAVIDEQVKAYEQKKKDEKADEIKAFWEGELRDNLLTIPPEWLTLEMIYNTRWLNASVSMAAVKDEIRTQVTQVLNACATLEKLPAFGFEALEVYKTTLDINKALNEGQRLADIQRRKEEAERARIEAEQRAAEAAKMEAEAVKEETETTETVNSETEPTDGGQWICFKAYLTTPQAQALKAFFYEHDIEFRPIKEG